jgi:uncharacterized membrane protein HdeD (DUF308 family)
MDAVAVKTSNTSWVLIAEGVALTLLGLFTIAWPGLSVATFTFIFALYALIAGIVNVIGGIVGIGRGWAAIGQILLGILFVVVGSYIFNHPGIAALTLVIFVGFTFVLRGIFEIVATFSGGGNKALGIISGVLGIVVGLILLRYPVGGGLAYVWVLGIYALVSGPMMIALGLGAGRERVRD